MDEFLGEVAASVPTLDEGLRILWRLGWAALLGGVIGWQRQSEDKPAGLRTHVLVSLGAALFVLVPLETGVDAEAISRVIQGIATGIGFIGAGAILKNAEEHRVEGLTTAATIWITTALGMAAGLGRVSLGCVAVALAWVVLALLQKSGTPEPRAMRSDVSVGE
jgi:putative Mg2+ transporter-C (MgtC) family protein